MKREILFTLLFLILIGLVFADHFLPPHVFGGNIEYSEDIENCEITANFRGNDIGVVGYVEENNKYEAEIFTNGEGGEVIFYIGAIEAYPAVEAEEFEPGRYTPVDLTINDDPVCGSCGNGVLNAGEECDGNDWGDVNDCFDLGGEGDIGCSQSCTFVGCIFPPEESCGDGTCNGLETCSSCSADCGACSSNNNPGGSGGGNNGGGGGGGGGGSNNNQNTVEFESLGNNGDNPNENINLQTNENPAPVTGGIIGFAKTGTGIGLIIAIVIVIAGIFVMVVRKRK